MNAAAHSPPEPTGEFPNLRAGYAAVDITPPVGTDLTGFMARSGPCEGVLDPLEARALVVEDAHGGRVALVACDLIGLGRHMIARVRRRASERSGVPAEAQLFNCSHTHSGPETGVISTIGVADAGYLAELEERLVEVVARAARSPAPVRLRAATGDVPEGLAINRVYRRVGRPEAYDRRLTVVQLEDDGGSPLATVVNFACHATALGHQERHASADYVAWLRRAMEAAGSGPVLYVNGCGGDVNPASMDARGRAAAEALGSGLAEQALALLREAPRVEAGDPLPQRQEPRHPLSPSLVRTDTDEPGPELEARDARIETNEVVSATQAWVRLPYLPLRTPQEAAAILAEGRARLAAAAPGSPEYRSAWATQVEYAARLARLHFGGEPAPADWETEVQALRIGPLAVVGLPGEIFSSLGRRIRDSSPFGSARTLLAGWTNDNVGYVPDRDAYPLGGYEPDVASRHYGHHAPWAPEAGDVLVDAAGRLLADLASRTQQ